MKKLLVLLQNAWGVEDGYVPGLDRDSFLQCHTWRRLKEVVAGLDVELHIRNSSPKVGTRSSSWFPVDIEYVKKEMESIAPDIILVCGKSGYGALIATGLYHKYKVVTMPHPAYRALSKSITSAKRNELLALLV